MEPPSPRLPPGRETTSELAEAQDHLSQSLERVSSRRTSRVGHVPAPKTARDRKLRNKGARRSSAFGGTVVEPPLADVTSNLAENRPALPGLCARDDTPPPISPMRCPAVVATEISQAGASIAQIVERRGTEPTPSPRSFSEMMDKMKERRSNRLGPIVKHQRAPGLATIAPVPALPAGTEIGTPPHKAGRDPVFFFPPDPPGDGGAPEPEPRRVDAATAAPGTECDRPRRRRRSSIEPAYNPISEDRGGPGTPGKRQRAAAATSGPQPASRAGGGVPMRYALPGAEPAPLPIGTAAATAATPPQPDLPTKPCSFMTVTRTGLEVTTPSPVPPRKKPASPSPRPIKRKAHKYRPKPLAIVDPGAAPRRRRSHLVAIHIIEKKLSMFLISPNVCQSPSPSLPPRPDRAY